MNKKLRVAGIILIIVSVICLLLGFLFRMAYYNTMDGSADLYQSLFIRMTVTFSVAGIALVSAIVCFILQKKNS